MVTKFDLLFHICGETAKDIGREYINKFRSFSTSQPWFYTRQNWKRRGPL